MKLNLGTDVEPQLVKINAQLETSKVLEVEQLLKEFKDVFYMDIKDLKGIPLELAHHIIKLDPTIPSTHQAKYRLNSNYVTKVKQIIDKLSAVGFIQSIEEAT
jgi:flagellin-specific chaperone FliS